MYVYISVYNFYDFDDDTRGTGEKDVDPRLQVGGGG